VGVPEASLEPTDVGLVPRGEGWFVLNARDSRWDGGAVGAACVFEGETRFEQLGVRLFALEPGQPMSMYHAEAAQEDFLVIDGEALLIVEGQERPMSKWDFVHCPAAVAHAIIGAGDGLCRILAVGSRAHWGRDDWILYPVNEVAARHGASVEYETNDVDEAYARFPDARWLAYREGWLP
jgi:uncharacterized cupin superfamily protein